MANLAQPKMLAVSGKATVCRRPMSAGDNRRRRNFTGRVAVGGTGRKPKRPASAPIRKKRASINNTNHAYEALIKMRLEKQKQKKLRVLPLVDVNFGRPEKKTWSNRPCTSSTTFSTLDDHQDEKQEKQDSSANGNHAVEETLEPERGPVAAATYNSSSSLGMMVKRHDIYAPIKLPRNSIVRKGKFISKHKLRRELLRERFVALAHHYVGVPYSQRYWPKDSAEYNSPFFLDCCGLVRQILRDMAGDLKFRIGPWNQAYLFDMLPQKQLKLEEMKPGDLVFYQAKFTHPEKAKKQKHDMVHIEVFVGGETGRATIGSRIKQAKVSHHSDYAFQSKYYTVYNHYFRSIDKWLDGVLENSCRECGWTWNHQTHPRMANIRDRYGNKIKKTGTRYY